MDYDKKIHIREKGISITNVDAIHRYYGKFCNECGTVKEISDIISNGNKADLKVACDKYGLTTSHFLMMQLKY